MLYSIICWYECASQARSVSCHWSILLHTLLVMRWQLWHRGPLQRWAEAYGLLRVVMPSGCHQATTHRTFQTDSSCLLKCTESVISFSPIHQLCQAAATAPSNLPSPVYLPLCHQKKMAASIFLRSIFFHWWLHCSLCVGTVQLGWKLLLCNFLPLFERGWSHEG